MSNEVPTSLAERFAWWAKCKRDKPDSWMFISAGPAPLSDEDAAILSEWVREEARGQVLASCARWESRGYGYTSDAMCRPICDDLVVRGLLKNAWLEDEEDDEAPNTRGYVLTARGKSIAIPGDVPPGLSDFDIYGLPRHIASRLCWDPDDTRDELLALCEQATKETDR